MTGTEQASPSGVVTFLFTDIEGSTRRWESDPEVMQAALAAHDQMLREVIKSHGGNVFKHTGDGVCAVFTSPKAAVEAAVATQQALELPVRMGISTGEAELRGTDYFGAVLNRAARVMAAGHGGQILLDGVTAGLLRGVDLVDLGARRLRDITQPVEGFQVCAGGLRTEFPPLTTQDATSGNLRVPNTSLIGREKDLGEVAAVLAAHQVVTLTGPGGVGKTRLALEVAGRVAESFPDGVWVIELAAVSDPAAVPEAVAAVLGITQQAGMSVAESVAAALEGRLRLLVVDNCEHVLDAAGDLIELILSRSSTVRVLATSREGLRVADEQQCSVPALEVRTDVDSSAATLFVERARAVASGTAFTGNEAAAVVEICRRLDGIPLAIELAASRMASMTATEVRDRLDDRFRLLAGSRRGPHHHHTLRHAVQWSYDLLDDAEKTLLNRCSVFAGGFDLAGACAVFDSDDEFATLDLLDALVRKSLLVADRSTGRTRFSLLETIRQFAEDRLVQSGQADEAATAHARYFAHREAAVFELWDGPRQREVYAWFDVELANLRKAFRWAADHHDLDTAAAIAVYAPFLGYWVEQYEPVAWAEELIEPAKAAGHRRLAQLYTMAVHRYLTGEVKETAAYIENGRAAIESGRFDDIRDQFDSIGTGYLTMGQPERSIEWCRAVIARKPGTHYSTRLCLALAMTSAGNFDEAMATAQDLLATAGTADNPHLVCSALLAYGWAYRYANPAAALDALHRGLQIAQNSGNSQMETAVAVMLSRLEVRHGEPADACDFLTLALRHYHDSGNFTMMRTPLAILAVFFDRLGRYESAATISEFAASPLARTSIEEFSTTIAHLRDVLGQETYESFSRAGEQMTAAAMVTYAFDQIDQARAQLLQDGESP